MAGNGWKLIGIDGMTWNDWEKLEKARMAGTGWELLEMSGISGNGRKSWKWLEMAGNNKKCQDISGKCWRGLNRLEMAGND